jgi:hypothetical protein
MNLSCLLVYLLCVLDEAHCRSIWYATCINGNNKKIYICYIDDKSFI